MNNSECKNLKVVTVPAMVDSSYAAHWFPQSTLSDIFPNSMYIAAL